MSIEESAAYGDFSSEVSGSENSRYAPIRDLSIGVLHLGPKTSTLKKAGFRTIGDLENVSTGEILRIPSIGRRTAEQVVQNFHALTEASDIETGINWDQFCASVNVPLLPRATRPETGGSFLRSIAGFITELAKVLADDTFSHILCERICQSPQNQKTLEEIGTAASPPLTRERVRQKEKKLLGQITGGLINDAYSGLGVHFRPEFSNWWRAAADRLSHYEDIDLSEFVEALSEVWCVTGDEIMPHLPVILAIVTGEPQMSETFRVASKIHPALFGELSSEVKKLPLSRLRVGKYSRNLSAHGCESAGHVIDLLRQGRPVAGGGKAYTTVLSQLNLLAGCLRDDDTIDWRSYRQSNRLRILPSRPPANAAEFAGSLHETVSEILSLHETLKRACDIFRLRTCLPKSHQMTLQAIADRMATHGPSIKREETLLLRFLNSVVIGHDFSLLSVWLDETWLSWWDEAGEIFRNHSEDYTAFSENLAWRWRLNGNQADEAAPVIWAVLSGYPSQRYSVTGARTEDTVPISPVQPGRIKLQGFRRVH